jgi:prepilin-type N-terminal cleavage/methylation domain-containing protein
MSHTIPSPEATQRHGERGFSLIEVMVAMSLLLVGLLGLAQVFYLGMMNASTSSAHLIAREKAREAIESVHTARDNRTIAWAQVRNVNPPTCAAIAAAPPQPAVTFLANGGGIFLNGEQELRQAGIDGLVNTGDDAAAGFEELPGPNGRFETTAPTDDVPLNQYWRTVSICDVNPDLRQIQVTVRYRVGTASRSYTLSTNISSFS